MHSSTQKITIVVADDDDADFLLAKRTFDKLKLLNPIVHLHNGQELVDFLRKQTRSCIILLDLNMPIKDGREALQEIRADEELNHIPIIVMTTSKTDEDIVRSYKLGVNAYIRKPIKQEEFLTILGEFKRFWLDIVELPFP